MSAVQHQEFCLGGASGVGNAASYYSVGYTNKGENFPAGSSLASEPGKDTLQGSTEFTDLAKIDSGPNPIASGML